MTYVYLSLAIVSEVIATTALGATQGLTRLWPLAITFTFYAIAFVFLALTLRTMPVGVAYAIWSGAGIVLIAGTGWALWGQTLDKPALLGVGLIIAGISVMQIFSASAKS
ncbi:MAG: QacE family quaternary ammonium compound efflux SMR transporter [Alphaproteobacteria bacterium]|nr:QacE family quaternary ammonium compound efflux SMR transporter [Alphaproteobacteria bacterium]